MYTHVTHKTSLFSSAWLWIITSSWINLLGQGENKNVENVGHFLICLISPNICWLGHVTVVEHVLLKYIICLGSDLLLTSAAAMLGSVGEVNINRWPSHSVSVCLAGSFAIQISGATLSKCFLVVLPLLLYRAAYHVSGLSFSCFLKHPGRYKRRD